MIYQVSDHNVKVNTGHYSWYKRVGGCGSCKVDSLRMHTPIAMNEGAQACLVGPDEVLKIQTFMNFNKSFRHMTFVQPKTVAKMHFNTTEGFIQI